MELKIIIETEKKIVYKMDTIKRLTNKFLKKFMKSLKKRGCKIIFDEPIKDEHNIFTKINHSKYTVAVCYSINRHVLFDEEPNLPDNITIFRFKNIRDYKDFLWAKTLEFYNTWKEYLDLSYLNGFDIGIKKRTRYLCLKKDKEVVALVHMMDWVDYLNKPVDWIGHIWISSNLKKGERKKIHKYISWWLKFNNKREKIQGVVHSFNIRSQKFFRKMGFKPECVHIIKSK